MPAWGGRAMSHNARGNALKARSRCLQRSQIAGMWEEPEGDYLASTNVVNLDALIRREELVAPSEAADDSRSLTIAGLEQKGLLYPALCKPGFQRETASWTPEQVADLICTFLRRDLIPAIILWRAGANVFVIDEARRLSALIAWVHDDCGDGPISRKYFHDFIPPERKRAATKTRDIVSSEVGSCFDHRIAIEHPQQACPDIASRAPRFGWQEIAAQWIMNADHDKAEKSFFRINGGGTVIQPAESRILKVRNSAAALSARAITRAGTGHNYWSKFSDEARHRIESLGERFTKFCLNLPYRFQQKHWMCRWLGGDTVQVFCRSHLI
jgi:hypothetical protein